MTRTRLLSHRIRGFGPAEGSIHNLRVAIAARVRLVEVDTRHTTDSEIVAHHPPCLGTLTTGRGLIGELLASEVMRQRFRRRPDEPLARLETILELVATTPDLEIWIDIKDYGLEERYAELVEDMQVYRQVRLISWIPETIMRLHRIDGDLRLGLSYAYTATHPILFHCLRKLATWFGFQSRPLAAKRRAGRMADLCATIPHFHPLPRDLCDRPKPELATGFNHAHLIAGLPKGALLESLIDGRGAIGVFASQATPKLVEEARQCGLGVYVYSVNTPRELTRLASRVAVDVVFCDSSRLITQQRD